VTYGTLLLLVGAPVACGLVATAVSWRAGHLLAGLATLAVLAGVAAVRAGAPLVIGDTPLALSQIGRLELGFLAGAGLLLTGYHYLARRSSPLPALLPLLLAAVASSRLFGPQLLVAASFLLFAVLLASLLMISEREDWRASLSGASYLILASLGGMALLFGFILAELQRISPGGLVTVPFVVAVLAVGFALQWGAAPLHFWLPGAVQRAGPAAITLAVGLLGPASLGLLLQALTALPQLVVDERVNGYLLAGGLVTAVLGAVGATAPQGFRRRLGYVLVADLGFVLAGVATSTRIGVAGAALHLAHRSLVTFVLVSAAAELERTDEKAGDLDVGARCPSPYLWATLLVGTLSLAGLPPFSGFAASWPVYQALALADWRAAIVLAATSLACLASLLSSLGPLRRVYPRPWPAPRPVEAQLMALALFSALWGLAPGPALGAIHQAVSELPFLKPF
jgi:formate hydrogenlyase subunit 3/multisubunit Na+/H+ antiporter MnhD subunit